MSIGRIAWRPPPTGGGPLSLAMKRALAEHEDTPIENISYGVTRLDAHDIPWLREAGSAGEPGDDLYEDTSTLIAAIGIYGRIRICNEVAD